MLEIETTYEDSCWLLTASMNGHDKQTARQKWRVDMIQAHNWHYEAVSHNASGLNCPLLSLGLARLWPLAGLLEMAMEREWG